VLVSSCCKLQLAEPEVTFALVAAAFRSVWWSTKMSTGTRPLKSKPQTYPNIAVRLGVPKDCLAVSLQSHSPGASCCRRFQRDCTKQPRSKKDAHAPNALASAQKPREYPLIPPRVPLDTPESTP
jgi:hypothetical protein